MFKNAIVRIPGSNFAQGLTTVLMGVPRFDGVLQQHARYCEALRECGLTITTSQPQGRGRCDAPNHQQLLSVHAGD